MIVLVVLDAVLIFLLIFCLVVYFTTFYSPHRGQNSVHNALPTNRYNAEHNKILQSAVDVFEKIPYESVTTQSYDGIPLCGLYYRGNTQLPLVICFHGYRGTAVRDCCGYAKIMLDSGFNVLIAEQRAQGRSGGHTITFGEKEQQDCLAWINFAITHFGKDVQIFLFGISMGATTVLLSLGLKLPQNVRGVIADCPYNSPKGILCKVCVDKKLSPTLSYPFLWLSAMLFGHFNPSKSSAVVAVKNSKVPVLLLHGEADTLVPCDMSREISAANPSILLETFPDAPHGASVFADKARYEKLTLDFIRSQSANIAV